MYPVAPAPVVWINPKLPEVGLDICISKPLSLSELSPQESSMVEAVNPSTANVPGTDGIASVVLVVSMVV